MRLVKWIARCVAGVDRDEAVIPRGAADDQRALDDVIRRQIAAGIDLRRACAVDGADDLIRARDEQARGGRAVVDYVNAIRAG